MTKHPPPPPCPSRTPKYAAITSTRVALGYSAATAMLEAQRCLNCKNPQCVKGCPVNVRIPEFISKVKDGDFEGAYETISATNRPRRRLRPASVRRSGSARASASAA